MLYAWHDTFVSASPLFASITTITDDSLTAVLIVHLISAANNIGLYASLWDFKPLKQIFFQCITN